MNEHTPIKRHQAIVSFSRDHHFGLLLVWKIRQGLNKNVSAERICSYVLYFFEEDIVKHFKDEEAFLFPILPVDDELRLQAEKDHEVIRKLIAEIREDKTNTALLHQLADELEKHIRFEERKLFNHLQSRISVSDLEKLENRLSNKANSVDENWKDPFWLVR